MIMYTNSKVYIILYIYLWNNQPFNHFFSDAIFGFNNFSQHFVWHEGAGIAATWELYQTCLLLMMVQKSQTTTCWMYETL